MMIMTRGRLLGDQSKTHVADGGRNCIAEIVVPILRLMIFATIDLINQAVDIFCEPIDINSDKSESFSTRIASGKTKLE